MGAHTVAGTHRTRRAGGHATSFWALPAAIGIAYGLYAWFLARDEQFSTRATVIGLVSGAAMLLLCLVLGRARSALMPEVRAAAYGAVAGAGVGYLHSLTGASVLTCVLVGLFLGAGVALAAFYVFHAHER